MRTLTYGSHGYDVDELQSRLGFLGYYHDKIDGDFGWDTYWAVRDFQYNFLGKATGVVDEKTKIKLVDATRGWHYHGHSGNSASSSHTLHSSHASHSGAAAHASDRTHVEAHHHSAPASSSSKSSDALPAKADGLSKHDLSLMAHVVYAEARGEPFVGQVAVAAVLLNRLHSPKFPHSLPAIVYQPEAFTSVQNGQINQKPNAEAKKAVMDAVKGWDPSHGATYYFNPAKAKSSWIWSKPEITKIGHHIFCK